MGEIDDDSDRRQPNFSRTPCPAQQRLHTGNLATGDIPLRLVVKEKLIALDRVPQARFEREHGDIGVLGVRLLIQAIFRVGAVAVRLGYIRNFRAAEKNRSVTGRVQCNPRQPMQKHTAC